MRAAFIRGVGQTARLVTFLSATVAPHLPTCDMCTGPMRGASMCSSPMLALTLSTGQVLKPTGLAKYMGKAMQVFFIQRILIHLFGFNVNFIQFLWQILIYVINSQKDSSPWDYGKLVFTFGQIFNIIGAG